MLIYSSMVMKTTRTRVSHISLHWLLTFLCPLIASNEPGRKPLWHWVLDKVEAPDTKEPKLPELLQAWS